MTSPNLRFNALARAILAMVMLSALNVAPAAVSDSDLCRIGSWSVNSSRESVQQFAEQGPFSPVHLTGGIETYQAMLSGQATHVSFVFQPDDQVLYIQHFAYEGDDIAAAKAAFSELAARWGRAFGGYKVEGFQFNGSDTLPADSANDVFKATIDLPLQAVRSEEFKRKSLVLDKVLIHATPASQPGDCRLHTLFGYSGQIQRFFVYNFVDTVGHVRTIPTTGVSVMKR